MPEKNSDVVYTRNFAPLLGINEEAATGTSNGALMHFLNKNGFTEKKEILSYQGESMDMISEIYCSIDDNDGVYVGGKAKIMIDGVMCI